jgi:hypothetical protein
MTPSEFVTQELGFIEKTFNQFNVLSPMVVFVKDNRRTIIAAEFHNDAHKDMVSEGIKELVKRAEPDVVIYSAEAWMIVAKEYKEGVTIRPSYHPDRIEIVTARIEFKTGEKYDCSAKILREKGKAWLDKFDINPDGGMSMGRFVDFYPVTRMN